MRVLAFARSLRELRVLCKANKVRKVVSMYLSRELRIILPGQQGVDVLRNICNRGSERTLPSEQVSELRIPLQGNKAHSKCLSVE